MAKRVLVKRPKQAYRARYLTRWDASFEGSTSLWRQISPPQLLIAGGDKALERTAALK